MFFSFWITWSIQILFPRFENVPFFWEGCSFSPARTKNEENLMAHDIFFTSFGPSFIHENDLLLLYSY